MTSKTISINFNEILSKKTIPLSDMLLNLIGLGNHGNYPKKKSFWRRVKKSTKICRIFNNYDENTLRKYYQMFAKNDINEFILYVVKNVNEINNTSENLGSVINKLF